MSVQLYNDDCINVLKNIDEYAVDLTVTSPPYDNLREYNGNISNWNFDKFKLVASELYRVTRNGGVVVWIISDATIDGTETGTSFACLHTDRNFIGIELDKKYFKIAQDRIYQEEKQLKSRLF